MTLCISLRHLLPLLLQLLPEIHITLTKWQTRIITSQRIGDNFDLFQLEDAAASMMPYRMALYFFRSLNRIKFVGVFKKKKKIKGTVMPIIQESFHFQTSTPMTLSALTSTILLIILGFGLKVFIVTDSCLTSTAAFACWKSGPDVANSSTQASADSSDTWITMKSNGSGW